MKTELIERGRTWKIVAVDMLDGSYCYNVVNHLEVKPRQRTTVYAIDSDHAKVIFDALEVGAL